MTWPATQSPLGGNLGAYTCSIFRLDPLGITALEPLADILPGLSPLRVTFDMIDGESASYDYDTTEHAIQSLVDITSHVRKRLETMTITGTFGATLPMIPFPGFGQPPSAGSFSRMDLLRFKNLKAIADARRPVMVVTPRLSLPRAIITSLSPSWSPSDGESLIVSMTVREVRLVSAILGITTEVDYPGQEPGNNATTGGGQSATKGVSGGATESGVTGVPPSVGASAGAG